MMSMAQPPDSIPQPVVMEEMVDALMSYVDGFSRRQTRGEIADEGPPDTNHE
jgi:hypothetical protein